MYLLIYVPWTNSTIKHWIHAASVPFRNASFVEVRLSLPQLLKDLIGASSAKTRMYLIQPLCNANSFLIGLISSAKLFTWAKTVLILNTMTSKLINAYPAKYKTAKYATITLSIPVTSARQDTSLTWPPENAWNTKTNPHKVNNKSRA